MRSKEGKLGTEGRGRQERVGQKEVRRVGEDRPRRRRCQGAEGYRLPSVCREVGYMPNTLQRGGQSAVGRGHLEATGDIAKPSGEPEGSGRRQGAEEERMQKACRQVMKVTGGTGERATGRGAGLWGSGESPGEMVQHNYRGGRGRQRGRSKFGEGCQIVQT